MNKFQQTENIGRQLMKEVLSQLNINRVIFTEERFDQIDGFFAQKSNKYGVEIKVRDSKYESYPTHLMEVSKFKYMCQLIKNKHINNAYYACFFGDNVLYLYSAKDIHKQIKEGKIIKQYYHLNRTTVYDNGKVNKQILLLPTNIAVKLVKENGKWKKL